MVYGKKIVLNCPNGLVQPIDSLIAQFKESGVLFVGVVGKGASEIEDLIDECCVGDGSSPYDMLTTSHEGASLSEAVAFAESLSGNFEGSVQVVEL